MRACIYKQYGPPEVVKLMEVEKPIPKNNEVLIRVLAATVNRTDCGFRSAEYFVSRFFSGLFKPKFHILGSEFAGVVEGLGNDVSLFKVGDRVFGFNDSKFGAHAEYLTIAEGDAISTIPNGLSYAEAAPILEGSHYALVDIRAAKVSKGQNVLIYGATGGIGSAAVQLVKHFGANVTAVCSTKHIELVKSLGADKVVDYTQEDYTDTELKYDFVFDAVGKTSFGKCKPILTNQGIYISTELGKNGQNVFLALLAPLLRGKKVLFPLPTINKDDVLFIKELVEAGKFKPLIDRHYPLEKIVEAYTYVETGQKIGNVVIDLAE